MTALSSAALSLMLAAAAPAAKEPAMDLSMHSAKVPGLTVKFVDYHWQPELFEAMAKGSRDVAEARRDWVLARLMIEPHALKVERTALPAASYALSLFPNRNDEGMAIEIRRVDLRELPPDISVMAPTPPGETMYRAKAVFEAQDPPAPRLDITAVEDAKDVVLTVRYGDRRLSVRLTR
jgi:hypothetical protein